MYARYLNALRKLHRNEKGALLTIMRTIPASVKAVNDLN